MARFAADLAELTPSGRLGLAVSGGPDSLALLLLTAAARPGAVEAATVDHGLRSESASEAALVADVCARLGVPHVILPVNVASGASLQAQARGARYAALADWAAARGLAALATAHHLDDQAETVLMRLARGSGLGGLAGVRPKRPLGPVVLIRPLLRWRKSELVRIVEEAGLNAVDDPANRDERHDRTRARQLLAETKWLEPGRLAASAEHLAEAEAGLVFAAVRLFAERAMVDPEAVTIDANGLPRELQRRLLLLAMDHLGDPAPRGADLDRALASLAAGKTCSLGLLKMEGGALWRLTLAPPRRVSSRPAGLT